MTWTSALQQFNAYLMLERSMSDNTLEAYGRDVQKFTQFIDLQKLELNPLQVRREHIEGFVRWFHELGLGAASQARILSGLRAFFKYLMVEDLIDEDPTELFEGPRLLRKIPEVLSVSEMQTLLASIDLSEPQGIRNRAMLETLYACGLRVSELVGLRMSNVFLEAGFLKVIGKNDKERLVPIGQGAVKYIRQYIDHERNMLEKIAAGHENILFLNRRGQQMTRVMVFYIIKAAVANAGITKTVSPHTFRHTFATHLVEGGADLKAVQDMLGHESITTTEIYTHIDTEYLKETIYLYHPRLKF